ncbi:hypothetical protein [Mucilaginibacter paludis]|uniref:Uncharacterized protein n=1 Tax=Mucilaginibacter paludis DSM 18603 TaxID=714943 RepID=H1Y5L0_9SPHI|nr:hypothetical protein [Mucilaginibacter paludis]EHQ29362.1 hypothetical protein Mucpa_5287 [Mucilaginibacter paludis DSM 18603]
MLFVNRLSLFYIATVACFVMACKPSEQDINALPVAVAGGEPGLYVIGGSFSTAADTFATPALWHGGGVLNLSTKKATSPRITAQGRDVYIAGNNGNECVYWKNGSVIGTLYTPANTSSQVTGIALMGADVYVSGTMLTAGYYPLIPVYWKNGVLNYLPHPTVKGGNDDLFWHTTGIAISGSDIYISGDNYGEGVYWKNGNIIKLPNSEYANGIIVSGTDVYVVGDMYGNPVTTTTYAGYWKNGVAVYMPNPSKISQKALAIAVKGNDIYVAGDISTGGGNTNAVYWKNGVLTTLSKTTGVGVRATGVCIDPNNNLYISGTDAGPGQYTTLATYWLNGSETVLSTKSSTATGLVFVQ